MDHQDGEDGVLSGRNKVEHAEGVGASLLAVGHHDVAAWSSPGRHQERKPVEGDQRLGAEAERHLHLPPRPPRS